VAADHVQSNWSLIVSETVVNVADDLSEVQARDLEAHFCMKKDYTVYCRRNTTRHTWYGQSEGTRGARKAFKNNNADGILLKRIFYTLLQNVSHHLAYSLSWSFKPTNFFSVTHKLDIYKTARLCCLWCFMTCALRAAKLRSKCEIWP